jgi:carboxymethylenebutenolidase
MSTIPPSPRDVPGAVLDTAAVAAEEVTYLGSGGTLVNGYLARPARTAGPLPGIVVIHDARGLSEHTRDIVRRLAHVGHVALGVDLYTREGGPPPDELPLMMKRLFSMSDATILGDLEGAADLLRARDDANGKVGCIGFCMGGRLTLLLACASDRLDAAVDCWGGFIDRATPAERSTPERPMPPLDLVERLHCPLLAAIGAEDQNPSPAIGERLRERLQASAHETRVEIYEGAGHAFFADYRPSYRPGPAAALWERVVPFLAKHLRGTAPAGRL